MSSLKQQTINSAKWNFFDRIASQAVNFILGIIIARFLAPSDYGTVGVLAIFLSISQTFIDSGFSAALIRKKNPTEEDFSTIFYFNFTVSLIAYALLFFSAPWIADFFKIPILQSVVKVQAITLIINAIMAVQVAMLNIKLDFKSLAKRNVTSSIFSGICGIILAYLGYGIWALIFQQIIAATVSLIFICMVCHWYPKTKFSIKSFKELGSFGSRLLAASLLHTIYLNLTTFAIGKFYSAKDLGFYSRGFQFASVPNTAINGVLGTVTYPIMAKIQDDEEHLIYVYRKYIKITSLCIFIFSGILCALAKPIILLTLTDKWSAAIIFLHLFAFSCAFDHLSTINLNLLKVKGYSNLYFRLEVIKKAIAISILFAAIPFGVIAICLSKLIYNQIAVIANTYYTGKLFHMGYIQQMTDIFPFLIRCIIACLPAYAITFLKMPHIVTIILGSCISLFLYWFMLRNNPEMKELVDLIKQKFGKSK
ncbi:lipopolysaccharide biosynthesis protein [uncultured Fibrobacter sp.]|uniref:lipopolysaccharide biosynthesis protein n=1 Tax=uncultured Fibrobacter sp. TaxID=261512 RepID=UPI0025CD681D|nr:lipopolysaccharide biosynthesis protein [uncultured Fibrobacter sp.]